METKISTFFCSGIKDSEGALPGATENTMAAGDRDAISAIGSSQTLVVEDMPYHPPPTDPSKLPKWYDELYQKQKAWVAKLNVVLGRG